MNQQNNNICISIVIPVYNEEKRINSFLTDVTSYLKQKTFTYEVVVVDDGSIDDTVKVIETMLARQIPGKFKIVKLIKNQGKGAAIRNGMLEATGDYVFFIDADGSTAITEIDNFIPHFSPDYDIYIAVRTKKHLAPFKRVFFGRGYMYLTSFFLQLPISDFTCGFKCYRLHAARQIFPRQALNNWSFDTEDLFIAKKDGFTVKEIPVFWKHVGGSKVNVLNNVIDCGLDLLRIRLWDLCGKYNRE